MARILEINTVATHYNAVGGIMLAIQSGLRAQGHKCFIAAGRPSSDAVINVPIGGIANTLTHALFSRADDSEGLHSQNATEAFLAKFKRMRIDLVHLHNLHGHYLHLPTLFKGLAEWGGPVVLSLHDCWWLTGHCASYAHRGCTPSAQTCSKCQWYKDEYPISYRLDGQRNFNLKRRLLSLLPNLTLTVPSRWMANEVARTGVDRSLKVIPNGVDTTLFTPSYSTHYDRKGILAVAARWTPNKRLDDIIAFAQSPHCNLPVTVVGNLMGQRLPQSVEHIPLVRDRLELAQIMARAQVFVNPSRADAFGLVTAEAMACGTPVVANLGSVSGELVSNHSGLLTDVSNVEALATSIRYVIDHPEEFSPRINAVRKFSRPAMVKRYITLIESLT